LVGPHRCDEWWDDAADLHGEFRRTGFPTCPTEMSARGRDQIGQVGNLFYATSTYSSFGEIPSRPNSGLCGSSMWSTTIDRGIPVPFPWTITCPSSSRTRTARIGSPLV